MKPFELPRDVRKLLVGLAIAAGRNRLVKEAAVMAENLDVLILHDETDLAYCKAYLWTLVGDIGKASACLGGQQEERAMALRRALDHKSRSGNSAPRIIQ